RASGMLRLDGAHSMYWEECGRADGIPAVFLHGGPGAGSTPKHRRFFDPDAYRIIVYDQRGAGRSRPLGELRDNTTPHLVADLEALRRHLGVERWLVFGGSWGSTLAIAYAEAHPERCLGLVLRGIFLCRPREIKWFYQEGCSWIFADVWEEFVKVIPEAERDDMVAAYYRRLTSADDQVRIAAARAWSIWEGSTSKLFFDPASIERFADPAFAEAFARIECHYFMNNCFFPTENYLVENVGKIRHLPGVIVQGRYDVVCPMTSAWDLHRAWPEAELHITPDAGHSIMEPGNLSALVEATDKFR
ncbi:MAG TPA: prolyl aminopeptidase, partial [Pyrinomonadaceae bacterium]|nr:prolyl aminopeptidase [Pyrinomonadaceae bacterium]